MDIWEEVSLWNKYIAYEIGVKSYFGRPANDLFFKIENCENPGWWVKIDLSKTPFENCSLEPVTHNVNEEHWQESREDWLDCSVKNKVFNGAGDPDKLKIILEIFFKWIRANGYNYQYKGLPPDLPELPNL